MTKRWWLVIGAAVAIVSAPASVLAGKAGEISCADFVAMAPDARDRVVDWLEGAEVASSKKATRAEDVEVGYDAFGEPVAEVVTACEADKKAKLIDKIRSHFRK